MRLEHAELLLDLAETGSFNQTADRFYTTVQNVSYRVKQLEKELGIQIFYRTNTGVTFTKEGEHVLEFAKKIQELYKELTIQVQSERLCDAEGDCPQNIKLYVCDIINIVDVKRDFLRQYPDISLILKEIENTAVLSSLFEDSCELALWAVNQEYFEQNLPAIIANGLHYDIITQDRVVVVMSSKNPLAKQKEKHYITSDDIMELPKSKLGLLPWSMHTMISEEYGIYDGTDIEMHRHIMLEENGVTFMPERAYVNNFSGSKYTARNYAGVKQHLYHVLLRKQSANHKVYHVLTDIIRQQFR